MMMASQRMTTRKMSTRHPFSDSTSPKEDRHRRLRPNRSGITSLQNKPSQAKSSRLQSIPPLHMTTRRAASRTATNSTAASILSADSRRNSLETNSQEAGVRLFKRARLSDHSSTTSETRSAVRQSEDTTPIPDDSNQDANIPDIVPTSEPAPVDDLHHISLGEDDSIDDERQDDDDSDVQRLLSPHPRRRGRKPNIKRVNTPTGSLADSLVPGTPLNGELDDLESDHDVQKAARRLPGRRRAPNADPHMEACLRRQLQLRMGHRAVSKALKPLLIELATRTAEQLDVNEDEEHFWDIEHHLALELRNRLEARLEVVENELRVNTEYYNQRLEKDEEYLQMQFKDRIAALHEDYIVRSEYKVLELGRQYEHEHDENVTDDEAGTLNHPLHGRPTPSNPTGYLDARHDSRSRFFLETEKLGNVRNTRVDFSKHEDAAINDNNKRAEENHEDALYVDADAVPLDFGGADEERQAMAAVALNIHRLAYAATHIEEEELRKLRPPTPVISNADALGLQALAAATEYEPLPASISQPLPANQPPYQHVHAGPPVKMENPYPELSAHAYPAAPQPGTASREPGLYPQTPRHASAYGPGPNFVGKQSPILDTAAEMSPATGYPSQTRSRKGSESAGAIANISSAQITRGRRGYSTSTASPNVAGSYQPYAKAEVENSPKVINYSPRIVRLPEPQTDGPSEHHALASPIKDRPPRPFWHNVLSDSQPRRENGSAGTAEAEDPYRRQPEAYGSRATVNGTFGHERKHSAPIGHVVDNNPFRQRSPPRMRSPQALQSPWRPQHTSLPLPPPPQPTGPPPPSSTYYPLPPYSASYSIYSQAPPQGSPSLEQQPPHPPPPPQQQSGVFFGPPPPPQYGSPPGPQQHHPWYRQ